MKWAITLTFIYFSSSMAAEVLDLKNLELKIKECKKEQFNDVVIQSAEWADQNLKNLNRKQKENLFYKDTLESRFVTLFGSKYLPLDTQLSLGARACGRYMDLYVESILKKEVKVEEIQFWISCMLNDYRENIPPLAQQLIECFEKK